MKNIIMFKNNTIKIDEGIKQNGKDEMNLIELPFTLLSKRNPKKIKTMERKWTGRGENGKEKKFYKIVTGSDKWGLPTFTGEEVYLACMELSHRQGFKDRKVHTTQYELLNMMKWPLNDGRSYERLIRTFNQLGGVWITTNAFWNNQNKMYEKMGFGIINNYKFFENEKRGRKKKYYQLPIPFGYFRWDDELFNSFQRGNIKTINTKLYFSLKNYTSKRLYRFVDKRLYKQEIFEIDLNRLAFDKLEMTGEAYKNPSKIIQNLRPAIQELKERGIAEIEIKKSKTESGYKACFSPITKSQVLIEKGTKTIPKAEALVNYFHKNLNPEKHHQPTQKEIDQAQELLDKYNQEEVKHIIDYAIEQAKKTNFEMCYFGAILNYVEESMGYVKEQKESELKEQYNQYLINELDEYIKKLDKQILEKELEDYEDIFYEKYPFYEQYKGSEKMKPYIERDYKKEKGKKIGLLSFEEWEKEQKTAT